jgi:drug/metabolite transporter (DMT)-like permease
MNYYFLIAIFAALFSSISSVLVKKTLDGIPLFFSIFLRSVVMVVCALFIFIFYGDTSIVNPTILLSIFGSGIIGFLGLVFMYKALQSGDDPGFISGLISINSVGVVVIGILFGNYVTISQIPGILTIIAGLIVATISLKQIKSSKLFTLSSGVPYVFLVMLFWGFSFNIDSLLGAKSSPVLVLLGIVVTDMILSGSVSIWLYYRNKPSLPNKSSLISILLSGIFLTIGFGLQIYAMSNANPGFIAMVTSSATIFSIIIARFLYKEKLNLSQYFGMFIVFLGLILLYGYDYIF